MNQPTMRMIQRRKEEIREKIFNFIFWLSITVNSMVAYCLYYGILKWNF